MVEAVGAAGGRPERAVDGTGTGVVVEEAVELEKVVAV